jgi:hypothetical protein
VLDSISNDPAVPNGIRANRYSAEVAELVPFDSDTVAATDTKVTLQALLPAKE